MYQVSFDDAPKMTPAMTRPPPDDAQAARIACAEAHQVLGALAHHVGLFDHPDVIRALDNLSAAADGRPVPHTDLLPWPKEALP